MNQQPESLHWQLASGRLSNEQIFALDPMIQDEEGNTLLDLVSGLSLWEVIYHWKFQRVLPDGWQFPKADFVSYLDWIVDRIFNITQTEFEQLFSEELIEVPFDYWLQDAVSEYIHRYRLQDAAFLVAQQHLIHAELFKKPHFQGIINSFAKCVGLAHFMDLLYHGLTSQLYREQAIAEISLQLNKTFHNQGRADFSDIQIIEADNLPINTHLHLCCSETHWNYVFSDVSLPKRTFVDGYYVNPLKQELQALASQQHDTDWF